MSYVAPTPVFTSGNAMAAAELNNNNTALRTYINIGIINADIASTSVTTTDIVRGEYFGVTTDHQFTTGDIYTQFEDLLLTNEKHYTAHTKPFDLVDTGTSNLFPIPGSGKRIILERTADVIYSYGLLAISGANPQLEPNRRSSGIYGVHTTGDVIHPGDEVSSSLGRVFTEDTSAIAPVDVDGSGNTELSSGEAGFYCRRWNSSRLGFTNLSPGIHHFFIAINVRCDHGSVKTLSSQIEVFYKAAV